MKLRDPELLRAYMVKQDFSQARLGRYAEVSRQFIYALCSGRQDTCSEPVGNRIEEALGLIPGTLFVRMESLGTGETVARKASKAAA